jgi:4-hydroxybenzoate polyprenyltransferase
MFASGQLIAMLVMGLLFGLIVQSQAKKKNQTDLGNMALGACIATSFIGGAINMGWMLSCLTMIGFLFAVNSKS